MGVQVLGDRAAEARTLGVLLAVLVAGGLVALLASLGVGWMYADRALVPIRDCDAPPARVRGRRQPRAADAARASSRAASITCDDMRTTVSPASGRRSTIIEAGTDRLTALVDDLLLLARTDSGAVELDVGRVDLGDLTIDAAGSLGAFAASHDVELRLDAEPVPLDGDAGRLRQLVMILIDNAVRHAAAAGGRRVEIGVRATDTRATLTIDDDGRGIRDEDLPRVFDRFWRASDAPAGGTGLGLAIARWIVERHGGSIAAANRPTGGARFEVRLPRPAATRP